MLKRRRRIQKYINALKSKKENLSKHSLLHSSLPHTHLDQDPTQQTTPALQGSWMEKQIPTSYPYYL